MASFAQHRVRLCSGPGSAFNYILEEKLATATGFQGLAAVTKVPPKQHSLRAVSSEDLSHLRPVVFSSRFSPSGLRAILLYSLSLSHHIVRCNSDLKRMTGISHEMRNQSPSGMLERNPAGLPSRRLWQARGLGAHTQTPGGRWHGAPPL